MLMKVFNKGQIVIPAEIRRGLGIAVGDMLDVVIDAKHRAIQLRPRNSSKSRSLAGLLPAMGTQEISRQTTNVGGVGKGLSR